MLDGEDGEHPDAALMRRTSQWMNRRLVMAAARMRQAFSNAAAHAHAECNAFSSQCPERTRPIPT